MWVKYLNSYFYQQMARILFYFLQASNQCCLRYPVVPKVSMRAWQTWPRTYGRPMLSWISTQRPGRVLQISEKAWRDLLLGSWINSLIKNKIWSVIHPKVNWSVTATQVNTFPDSTEHINQIFTYCSGSLETLVTFRHQNIVDYRLELSPIPCFHWKHR